MKVLLPPNLASTPSRVSSGPVVLVVGLGLIGEAIVGEMVAGGYSKEATIPISWGTQDGLKVAVNQAIDHVGSCFAKDARCKLPRQVMVVWSAGKAGFGCDRQQMEEELANYKAVVDQFVARKPRSWQLGFCLFSSAGGLYEGLANIHLASPFSIKRPYGELKLAQEQYLETIAEIYPKIILRPSGVYGRINLGKRMGLIPTMIYHGLSYQVTRLVGSYHTLRDFVWAGDVGRFVRHLMTTADFNQPDYLEKIVLATGKPCSIYEIKKKIEAVIHRNLYVAFSGENNGENITYLKPTHPFWKPASETECIRQVYCDWVGSGFRV